MQIEHADKGTHVVIRLSGSLSNEFVESAHKEIRRFLDGTPRDIIVDMGDVNFLCSAALGLLFSSLNEAKESGRRFSVCCVRDDIRELFVITGVDRHLPVFDSIEEAEKVLA